MTRRRHPFRPDREIAVVPGSLHLAAATLSELGFAHPGDVIGGFTAWQWADSPKRPTRLRDPGRLPGMAPPEP